MYFKYDELLKSQDKMRRFMMQMHKLQTTDSKVTTFKKVELPFEEEAAYIISIL